MQSHDERVAYFLEDQSFCLRIILLISSKNNIFFQCFHGKILSRVFFLNEINFSKAAASNDLVYLEIIDLNIAACIKERVIPLSVGSGGH